MTLSGSKLGLRLHTSYSPRSYPDADQRSKVQKTRATFLLEAWELVSLGAVIVTVKLWAKAVLILLGLCFSY